MPASDRRGLFLKVLLSLFICFHVAVVVIMPNGMSFFGRAFGGVIRPYAAVIGLNTSWNFFSPDPAHTMYLKFTIHFEDEDGNPTREPEELYFPEARDEVERDLSKRRELYAMRYMILDPRRIDAIIGPWLCRRHPGASVVHIEFVISSIPTLDEAILFHDRQVGEMGEEFDFIDKDYRCTQVGNEVTL